MRKFWMYTIPLLVLAGFVVIMNSGDILKKPMTGQDNFSYYLQEVEQAIVREDWDAAQAHSANLDTAWKRVSPRIQFSVDKDEMKSIEVGLSRLQAFLQAQDRSQALATSAEIREHWEHLNE